MSYLVGDLFSALEAGNKIDFWNLTPLIPALVGLTLFFGVLEILLGGILTINWRKSITSHYLSKWLEHKAFYHSSIVSSNSDNPDQRIADDVNRFVDGGGFGGGNFSGMGVFSFTMMITFSILSLSSFAIMLWNLSPNFLIGSSNWVIPGLLFWVALLYSGIGAGLAHLVAQKLMGLQFKNQRLEADFRFGLGKVRSYSEQIALLDGEDGEKKESLRRFDAVRHNFIEIVHVRKRLKAIVYFYEKFGPYLPILVAAPFFFVGSVGFGLISQVSMAFGRVEGSFRMATNCYSAWTEFLSTLNRLITFESSLHRLNNADLRQEIRFLNADSADYIEWKGLIITDPDGKVLTPCLNEKIMLGEKVLISGATGSGKSTFFRVISGAWPWGRGDVYLPSVDNIVHVPQNPYFPEGTLLEAICYPQSPVDYLQEDIVNSLKSTELFEFILLLQRKADWMFILSGGEKQKLAIIRALLKNPVILLLDESTSAMDNSTEKLMYNYVMNAMKHRTVISIGHRKELKHMHDREIVFIPELSGSPELKSISPVNFSPSV